MKKTSTADAETLSPERRAILEKECWRRMNGFGWGPWEDGANQCRIDEIDAKLAVSK